MFLLLWWTTNSPVWLNISSDFKCEKYRNSFVQNERKTLYICYFFFLLSSASSSPFSFIYSEFWWCVYKIILESKKIIEERSKSKDMKDSETKRGTASKLVTKRRTKLWHCTVKQKISFVIAHTHTFLITLERIKNLNLCKNSTHRYTLFHTYAYTVIRTKHTRAHI